MPRQTGMRTGPWGVYTHVSLYSLGIMPDRQNCGVCTHMWLYSLGITWTQTEIKV